MGTTIGFISIKGGVGKTTLALETASALANDFRKKVLLIDGNFSAPNLDKYLGVEPELTLQDVLKETDASDLNMAIYEKHNFDIVPAAMVYKDRIDPFKLKKVISRIKNKYDFIIIDSSPNYNELVPVVAAADKLFIVTTPDNPTLTTSLRAAEVARENNTPIEGLIINKIRNPKFEMNLEEIEEHSNIPVVARIFDNKKMAEALHFRVPLNVHDNDHAISTEIKHFAAALCGTPTAPRGLFSKIFSFWDIPKEEVNREVMRQGFYERVL